MFTLGSHSDDYEAVVYSHLGCDIVQSGRSSQNFRRNVRPLSSWLRFLLVSLAY
jgi:hypothetical protein